MVIRIPYFSQPGWMGCEEQKPINEEVQKALNLDIEEIDTMKNSQYIKKFQLKVTPTITILRNGEVIWRLEGVVHQKKLETVVRKFL